MKNGKTRPAAPRRHERREGGPEKKRPLTAILSRWEQPSMTEEELAARIESLMLHGIGGCGPRR